MSRLGGMNPASVGLEKVALASSRLPQPECIAGAIHVPRFELRRGKSHKLGGAFQVIFSDVDVALTVAALRATGLTGEPDSFQTRVYIPRTCQKVER